MSYLSLAGAIALFAIPLILAFKVRPRRKWVIALGSIVLVLCWVVAAVLGFGFLISHSMCGEYEFAPVLSPDGTLEARVTEFDCGAVSSFLSNVELRQTGTTLGIHRRWSVVFSVEDDPRLVQISWTSSHDLTIRHPKVWPHSDAYQCDARWRAVHIKCEEYVPVANAPLRPLPEPNRWGW